MPKYEGVVLKLKQEMSRILEVLGKMNTIKPSDSVTQVMNKLTEVSDTLTLMLKGNFQNNINTSTNTNRNSLFQLPLNNSDTHHASDGPPINPSVNK